MGAAAPTCIKCGTSVDSYARYRNVCSLCKLEASKTRAYVKEVADILKASYKASRAADLLLSKLSKPNGRRPDWYSKEERRVYQMAYYTRRRSTLITMLGSKCVDCQSDADLEFDHIDPRLKMFDITSGILSRKWDVIVKEAKKCKLRCRVCHLKRTSRLRHNTKCRGMRKHL